MVSIHLEAKYSNVGQKNDEFGFALHLFVDQNLANGTVTYYLNVDL